MYKLSLVLSFIGSCMLAYSTFARCKRDMLVIQFMDCLFCGLACLCVGSVSGFTTNFVAGVRNLLNAKGLNTKVMNLCIIAISLILGIVSNRNGIFGLLPVIASLEYSIIQYRTKSAQSLKIALVVNLVLWCSHDFIFRLWISAITDIVIICFTCFNILKHFRDEESQRDLE